MRTTALHLVLAAAAAMGLLAAAPAAAQPTRAFVSAHGSDANSCSFAGPCRTFQHAHDILAPGGEIDVLDPAGYGAVNINKAISIQGHGFAGISVAGGTAGISIAAGRGAIVNLSGLVIDGNGAPLTSGILLQSAAAFLSIENCVVRAVAGHGLGLEPALMP